MEQIIELLTKIDVALFYFINNSLKNPVFDFMMPIITNEKIWIIPFVLTALTFLIFGKTKIKIIIVLCVIAVAITDPLCYRIIKPFIGRNRPFVTLPHVSNLVNAGLLSFPSNHAANIFTVATIIFYFSKRVGIYFVVLSLLIGFSRIYVGVHYPLDVLSGLIIGFCVAVLIIITYNIIVKKELKGKNDKKHSN